MKLIYMALAFIFLPLLMPFQSAFSQSTESNKAIVLRYFEEVVNKRNVNLVDAIFSDNYRSHSLLDSTETAGIGELKQFLPYLFKAFPDLHYTVGEIMAEGDKVVIRVILSGTHKSEFLGVQPSGRRIDYLSEVFFFRVENGKIEEGWVQVDLYNLFKKLKGEQ